MKLRDLLLALIFIASTASVCNAQTDSVVIIPGTGCTLVLPVDFVLADQFKGIGNPKTGATITITEIPTAYSNTAPGLSKETLFQRGLTVNELRAFTHNGFNATLIKGVQTEKSIEIFKIILLFGDDSSSILVNGICRMSDSLSKIHLEQTILSSKTLKSNLSSKPPIYVISTAGTKFERTENIESLVVYTIDTIKAPHLFIQDPEVDFTKSKDRKSYTESLLNADDLLNKKILSSQEKVINGWIAHETIAKVDGYGETNYLYKLVIFDVKGYCYKLTGTTTYEKYLVDFKHIANTFNIQE